MQHLRLSTRSGAQSSNKRKLLLLITIITAALAMIIFFVFMQKHLVLQIENGRSGDVYYVRPVSVGEKMTLHYTHSVTRQPVEEIYVIKDSRTIAITDMYFDEFGANLPVGSETTADETTIFNVEEDYYHVQFPNRTFDAVPLRIGQVIANHTLIFEDGSRLPLLDVAPGGTFVKIRVVMKPFWSTILS